MTVIDTPASERDANGRFARGNPGRPIGSRNRVSKRVARAILRDFEANQAELLPRMREWFLPLYVSLVGRLLPRVQYCEAAELDDLSEIEAARLIADAREALARIDAGEASLAELEAALLGEGGHNSGAVVIGE